MANLADITDKNDFTEEMLTRQLTKHPGSATLVPRGKCLNCEALLPDTHLYCDAECREDFEAQERVSKNTRRP